MDSSSSTSETNVFLIVFTSLFVSFGVCMYICSGKSNFKQEISTSARMSPECALNFDR